jgi:L-cysteine/cystine lyase
MTAAAEQFDRELQNGRSGAEHSAAHGRLAEQLRARLANVIGASTDEVALTHSTTEGINIVLSGLRLGEGDEVLTSDEEHPGLLGPLGALQRRGIVVRQLPLADIADAAGPKTRLVAVSHVSWMRGLVAPVEQLAAAGPPLLLDGAQGAGAIPVDVHALGCDFYAAAGQKWLCGPDGTGLLYVRADRITELGMPWPSYVTLGDPARPFDLIAARGARRFDGGEIAGPVIAASLASLDVLEGAGWDWVFTTSQRQAQKLRDLLADRVELIQGGATTLVTWRAPEVTNDEGALAEVKRLEAEDVIVRAFTGKPWLRASVGAWSSDADLERLVALCS